MQPRRFAQPLAGQLAVPFDEHGAALAHRSLVERQLRGIQRRLQTLQPLIHHLWRDLVGHGRRRGAGAWRVFEAEAQRIADLFDQLQRLFKFGLCLAREADDEITRNGDIGPDRADLVQNRQIARHGVIAVHRFQHAVAAGLHWQMQERHQLGIVAVRRDQALGHVTRMTGGIADPREAGHCGQRLSQLVQPATIFVAPGVDVLTQQREFFRACCNQPLSLCDQIVERPRDFRAAGIGNDAIGAELVAALLHRQKGAGSDFAPRGQGVEFGFSRHVGIDRAASGHRFGDHRRQAVIGLRADDHRH